MLNAAAMLSTFVLMPPHGGKSSSEPSALVRTLAALVPAAIDGLVRDVTVLALRVDAAIETIAEDAGCDLVTAESFETALQTALDRARSSFLFLLRNGATFDHTVVDEVGVYFSKPRPIEATHVLLVRQGASGLLSRVLPKRAPVVGLIASRNALAKTPKSFEALVRAARPSRTLSARAQMAG